VVEVQGINVADKASGAGGDVTVRRDGQVVMAFEITERAIDENRVRRTYADKISPQALSDYVFVFHQAPPTPAAEAVARKLFAQGHDLQLLTCLEFVMRRRDLSWRRRTRHRA
jgi:hypothetical protein